MAKASDNEFPSVLLDEQASAPTTPATGFWRVYAKSDGLYIVDDAGAETGPLGTGGGGGGGDASWTNVTYQNSWVTYVSLGDPVQYRKLSSGLVVIQGAASSGTAGSAIFTLPVGYRPTATLVIPIRATGTANTIRDLTVNTDGTVVPASAASNAVVFVSGSFYAG